MPAMALPSGCLDRPRWSEAELVARLRSGGPTLVALSGGVDSAVVAALAYEALTAESVAVTLAGPSVSRAEVARARSVARSIGIAHEILEVDPLVRPEYRANPPNRCYFCRQVETARLLAFGRERGIGRYLDGVHVDDLGDERPGLRAMDEAGFSHPLLDAGWRKAEVRAVARGRGLPNWDQPSDACLASRVAHGAPIDAELLGRIEAAEKIVRGWGFRRVRVRVRGPSARIEVDPDEVPRLTETPLVTELEEQLRALGFAEVSMAPEGYRGRREAVVR